MQRHNVIIPKGDGGVEVYPMKQWLRDHPENLPPGMETTTSTSHQLRGVLRKRGWTMKETPQQILLMPPNADLAEVEQVTGSDSDNPAEDPDEIAFTLEYQLRDFIAANLSSIDVNGKRLRLYIDAAGRDGIEFSTEVGFHRHIGGG